MGDALVPCLLFAALLGPIFLMGQAGVSILTAAWAGPALAAPAAVLASHGRLPHKRQFTVLSVAVGAFWPILLLVYWLVYTTPAVW